MFVLPPPPTYTSARLYGANGQPGLIETNNLLTHPEGPEHQLVLGEGTYILREEILLATPPPHPSDLPVPNNNPLATEVAPPTSGTKLVLTPLVPRRRPRHELYRLPTATSGRSGLPPPPSIPEERSTSLASDNGSSTKINGLETWSTTTTFGGNNPALAVVNVGKTKDADKKKKPKNNIVKSNSSFVSRVIVHEHLQKRLAERNPDGLLVFGNITRGLSWLDLASDTKTDNLTKILFTKANVLCHDLNELTTSVANLDILLGFNTSDIIWLEPVTQKYTRLNKNGSINKTAVKCISWLPHSENLFIAAHMDGSLIVYDRDKEDAPFVAEASPETGTNGTYSASSMYIKKSVQSRNQKTNPVSNWNLGLSKINAISFSPDGTHLAVVSEDGTLKILDFLNESLLDIYKSYYGGLLSVTWSPDGRYILTGGQDDLVSIWSFADSALVARCPGHSSWVTDVKFDPWRCDERNYRFGSIGEDRKLLLWDFSVGMLGKPKGYSVRRRVSDTSALHGRKESTATMVDEEGAALEPTETNGLVHGVNSRSTTATLPPVMSKQVDDHPLSWLGFEEDCIVVACHDGHIRTWNRPQDATNGVDGLNSPSNL